MTNTKALRSAISDAGMTLSSLARIIGISRQKLYYRMNKPDFRLSEIESISKALHLSRADRDAIFFGQERE